MTPLLLFAKQSPWCDFAASLCGRTFPGKVIVYQGKVGDALPKIEHDKGAHLVSFLSPWILPEQWLSHAASAINFHPGSCDYPGIGSYNFALYEGAKQYGSVCHHMLPKVDTGEVIDEIMFEVQPNETVESLKLQTLTVMLAQLGRMLTLMAEEKPFPRSARQWSRRAFTRRELNELCRITPDMTGEEIRRRVRATTYPGYPGPELHMNGEIFKLPVPAGPALA